jgi:predicted lipoprotein with Yx(FWY)xxD motif
MTMNSLPRVTIAALLLVFSVSSPEAAGLKRPSPPGEHEDYVRDPVPPGFQVIITEVDGPIYADAEGRTLYTWPIHGLRNGDAGEEKGKPTCDDHVYTETAGLMSPYPPGLTLPNIATRPSCIQMWPPALAPDGAKPAGKWTVVVRKDGRKQWAYDDYALYTSVLDRAPGDVMGGDRLQARGDGPAVRQPIGPDANVPPQFVVLQTMTGRLLTTSAGLSVYTSEKDSPNKSNCTGECLAAWEPVLAGQYTFSNGDWSVFERMPGVRQWAFRKKPLYRRIGEEKFGSFEGGDVPGWHNVYTQKAPPPPKAFTIQAMRSGLVLGDSKGRTVYIYHCADDAIDQLACDHPDTPQEYRFAVCGGRDSAACLATFPYVIADKDAKSDTRIWSVMDIDPKTGHRAKAGQSDALHVWAYRDRPVFTFFRDKKPGDVGADPWGEFYGWRNGYKAFWLRDDFTSNAQ